jgi:prepilin-type N-terminal cleavage/methylation domain-containing protein
MRHTKRFVADPTREAISGGKPNPRAFTLIELLIVVAIIAILAAIAVPNFLEAQTRSKVSRTKSDMRSIATALESYCVDSNMYPTAYPSLKWTYNMICLTALTTPISYITSFPRDPFKVATTDPIFEDVEPHEDQYIYWGSDLYWTMGWRVTGNVHDVAFMDAVYGSCALNKAYVLCSVGPDHLSITPYPYSGESQAFSCYDASNGTKSNGNILRTSLESEAKER